MYKKLDETALEAILEAGIEEFARCGFQPASIADVAKKAGVSVGVIYKYYNDKETFFLACVRHSLDLLDQTLQEVIAAGGSMEDRVRRLITALITQSRQHASYNAMYNEITAGSCRKFAPVLAREIEQKTAALYTALSAAQQRGEITAAIAPELFAFFFDNLLMMLQFSCSCEYYRERMEIFCGKDAAQDDRTLADALTRFLLGAMKGEG